MPTRRRWAEAAAVVVLIGLMAGCRSDTKPGPAIAPPEPPPGAEPVRLHLSFDDAPWAGELGADVSPERIWAVNEAIVGTLAEHGAPASVFFNCDRLQPDDGTVELWSGAEHEVGNHTSSHANLADTPLPVWMDDVQRCHDGLTARLPGPPRWFRYPYLSQGHELELREQARERLTALGYTNAHVTVATTEWLLAFAYRRAKEADDRALMDELVQAYRDHMLESVEQARAMAREEVGRETAQIVLFHVNELAADHLAEVLADFDARGYVLIGLEEALADPVFEREDHYVGRGGLSWLARIHEDPDTRPPYWFGLEEGRLTERYGALLQAPAPAEPPPAEP